MRRGNTALVAAGGFLIAQEARKDHIAQHARLVGQEIPI